MAPDKLTPSDPRVRRLSSTVRGKTYSYLLGVPPTTPIGTVLLVHGFPDTASGWRFQVPFFLSRGYRVIVPDMLGYGLTSRPDDLAAFSLKSMSADLKALVGDIVGPNAQIILGGHDWGGALVWRAAMWHPELIAAVFSVCTPYVPPKKDYFDIEAMVTRLPNFTYQIHLAGPEVEARLQSEESIRQFLNSLQGGSGANGEVGFDVTKGVLFDNLPLLRKSRLVSEEELTDMAKVYMQQPEPRMRGPLNWYRTRKLNYDEELPVAKEGGGRLEMPALMVTAAKDAALPPWMAGKMGDHFAKLTTGQVEASHWALTQTPEEVNALIGGWLDAAVEGKAKARL